MGLQASRERSSSGTGGGGPPPPTPCRMQEAEATNPSRGSYDPQVGTRIPVHCICSCVQSFYKHPCDPQTLLHTHVMCLTSAQPCTWIRVSQPGASWMLPVCSPDTLHRTSSPRCVSPGVHIASFATPKPALSSQHMPCTCAWPLMSEQCVSLHLPTCVPENIHQPDSCPPSSPFFQAP